MTLDSAIVILEMHQLWRRGLPPYDGIGRQQSYTAKELGEAIDIILNAVKEIKK